jgi:2-dehydropantoate 2-reductase
MATPDPLKVTVMGAGAVGCYFGGMLARAGHEVTLIARPQHVEAIARDGLRMETKSFDEHVRLAATTDVAAAAAAEASTNTFASRRPPTLPRPQPRTSSCSA